MPTTPATGSIAAVADAITAAIGAVKQRDAEHNTAAMVAAKLVQLEADLHAAVTKAIADNDLATEQKDDAV